MKLIKSLVVAFAILSVASPSYAQGNVLGQLTNMLTGSNRANLPPTNLDSFVYQSGYNQAIYGDEGDIDIPPLDSFTKASRINAGINGVNAAGLTTGHGSLMPDAWGADEFLAPPGEWDYTGGGANMSNNGVTATLLDATQAAQAALSRAGLSSAPTVSNMPTSITSFENSLTAAANSAANSANSSLNSALNPLNSLTNFGNRQLNSVNNAVTGAANSVNNAATSAANSAANTATNTANSATTAATTTAPAWVESKFGSWATAPVPYSVTQGMVPVQDSTNGQLMGWMAPGQSLSQFLSGQTGTLLPSETAAAKTMLQNLAPSANYVVPTSGVTQ